MPNIPVPVKVKLTVDLTEYHPALVVGIEGQLISWRGNINDCFARITFPGAGAWDILHKSYIITDERYAAIKANEITKDMPPQVFLGHFQKDGESEDFAFHFEATLEEGGEVRLVGQIYVPTKDSLQAKLNMSLRVQQTKGGAWTSRFTQLVDLEQEAVFSNDRRVRHPRIFQRVARDHALKVVAYWNEQAATPKIADQIASYRAVAMRKSLEYNLEAARLKLKELEQIDGLLCKILAAEHPATELVQQEPIWLELHYFKN